MVAPRIPVTTDGRAYVLRVRVNGDEYTVDLTHARPVAEAAILETVNLSDVDGLSGVARLSVQGAFRLLMPLLPGMIARVIPQHGPLSRVPLMPRLPRHADPITHFARWLVAAAFAVVGSGTYELVAREDDAMLDERSGLVLWPVSGLRWHAATVDDLTDTSRPTASAPVLAPLAPVAASEAQEVAYAD